MTELPAVAAAETEFAVLLTTSIAASVPAYGGSSFKFYMRPVVLEVTETISKELITLRTLGCIKDVFPYADS